MTSTLLTVRSGLYAAPDALIAAAAHVQREYGYTGYRLGLADICAGIYVFEVRHSDGSAFNVAADRWGNVETIPADMPQERVWLMLQGMAERAAAS